MAQLRFEADFDLKPVTKKDEKTGLYVSKLSFIKNASGVGRTKKEAEDNLFCSFSNMWEKERQAVIETIMSAYFPQHNQRPNNIDLMPA